MMGEDYDFLTWGVENYRLQLPRSQKSAQGSIMGSKGSMGIRP